MPAQVLRQAIALAQTSGYLGDDVLGSGKTFDLEVRRGAGAYICGEETVAAGKPGRQARR